MSFKAQNEPSHALKLLTYFSLKFDVLDFLEIVASYRYVVVILKESQDPRPFRRLVEEITTMENADLRIASWQLRTNIRGGTFQSAK